jgi:hypothetical protein
MSEITLPTNKSVQQISHYPRIGSRVDMRVLSSTVTPTNGMRFVTDKGVVEIEPTEVNWNQFMGSGKHYEMKDNQNGYTLYW